MNNYTENDIISLKLVSGEEVLGKFKSGDSDIITIEKPLVMMHGLKTPMDPINTYRSLKFAQKSLVYRSLEVPITASLPSLILKVVSWKPCHSSLKEPSSRLFMNISV